MALIYIYITISIENDFVILYADRALSASPRNACGVAGGALMAVYI